MSSSLDRSVFGGSYLEFYLLENVAAELSQMVARGLAPITACGFLTALSDVVVDDVERHVRGVSRVRVVASEKNGDLLPIAFVAADKRQDLYHLGGIIVEPEHQGQGIGRRILQDELATTGAELLAFHTQNLHMMKLGGALSQHDYELALLHAATIGSGETEAQEIDGEQMLVQLSRYGGSSLYGDLSQFTQMGRQIPGLNTERGDAIVYVGRIK